MRGSAHVMCMSIGCLAASQPTLAAVAAPSASMVHASNGRVIVNSDGPPAPPGRVSASVYSPGVADIVGSPSPDHAALAGYEIRRNGTRIAFHKGRSQIESGRKLTQDHDYAVVAVDRQGRRSLPARFRLSGDVPPLVSGRQSGRGPVGCVSTIEQPRSSVTNTSSSGAADPRCLLLMPITRRARLQEGASEYRVPVTVFSASASANRDVGSILRCSELSVAAGNAPIEACGDSDPRHAVTDECATIPVR